VRHQAHHGQVILPLEFILAAVGAVGAVGVVHSRPLTFILAYLEPHLLVVLCRLLEIHFGVPVFQTLKHEQVAVTEGFTLHVFGFDEDRQPLDTHVAGVVKLV